MALTTEQRSLAMDLPPNVVRYATPAERWLRDTALEAAGTHGDHSTRKEIIFAASFLESYIFEWARSLAVDRLDEYFPPMPRFQIDPRFKRSLQHKWKQIPAELYADKIIPVCPQLKLLPLGKLVKYRHGLIHARASRRVTVGTSKKTAPLPAFGDLDLIAHGWALGVAKQLVEELHNQLGTPPPAYF
jgi:hypothetical protein